MMGLSWLMHWLSTPKAVEPSKPIETPKPEPKPEVQPAPLADSPSCESHLWHEYKNRDGIVAWRECHVCWRKEKFDFDRKEWHMIRMW
jgi:hypothetical protein